MEHLHNCEKFVCPVGTLKCPRSYCVPGYKVCNGVWDCDGGFDEINCDEVYESAGRLRCRRSSATVAQTADLCDGKFHCPVTGDDELFCDMVGKCPNGCRCIGYGVDCSGVGSIGTDAIPFKLPGSIRALLLSGCGISVPERFDFTRFLLLGRLDLSANNITELAPAVLDKLVNLYELDLRNNALSRLTRGVFASLKNLRYLLLRGNPISSIEPGTFVGLARMTRLDLSALSIRTLKTGVFRGLNALLNLNLSGNGISTVQTAVFDDLPLIGRLDLRSNGIAEISQTSFSRTPNLDSLFTDSYRLCCLAPSVKTCTPAPDEFSSCDELIASDILRIAVWITGFFALFGNAFVIGWRITDKNVKFTATVVFTVNLAISDTIMGAYLLIIAASDYYYLGVFNAYAQTWENSSLCTFCGFLVLISSECSLAFVLIIAIERAVTIWTGKQIRSRRISVAISGAVWAMFILVATIPLTLGLANVYGQNGVCLPLTLRAQNVQTWGFSFGVFVCLNGFGLLLILVAYAALYLQVRRSRIESGRSCHTELLTARRLMPIFLVHVACWAPVISLSIAAITGVAIPNLWSATIAIIILPINSAVNPVLYTFSSMDVVAKLKQCVNR
ncbi:G-protein coupled receptor GRL101-like [Tubulanus polymorphus]|uniref:G-protein coupled receptor GRL101-like n=1 Tax=Tubulanus polymorphus TaxID=672921 RepID=UPI003DA59C92